MKTNKIAARMREIRRYRSENNLCVDCGEQAAEKTDATGVKRILTRCDDCNEAMKRRQKLKG